MVTTCINSISNTISSKRSKELEIIKKMKEEGITSLYLTICHSEIHSWVITFQEKDVVNQVIEVDKS